MVGQSIRFGMWREGSENLHAKFRHFVRSEGSLVFLKKIRDSSVASLPRNDRTPCLSSLLAEDREGLLLLSQNIAFLEELVRRSGPRDVYAELRPGKERHAVGTAARRLGISAVVTGGVMFANAEDWALHRLRVAIAGNEAVSRLVGWAVGSPEPPNRPTAQSPTSWLRPAADLTRHFPDCPDALARAAELAERCGYRIPIGHRVVAPPRVRGPRPARSGARSRRAR